MTASRHATRPASRAQRAGGQGLVEFALVVPVFLAMLFALLDGGRYVYINSVLSQAAREGARLAAVEASWLGSTDSSCGASGGKGPVCPATVTVLKADALAAANRMVTPFGPITSANFYLRCDAVGSTPTGAWTGVSCTTNSSNSVVSVRVVLTFNPVTPLASQIVVVTLSGSASMVIN